MAQSHGMVERRGAGLFGRAAQGGIHHMRANH